MSALSYVQLPVGSGWITASTDPEFRTLIGHAPITYNPIYKVYACWDCGVTVTDVKSHLSAVGPHSHQLASGNDTEVWSTALLNRFPEADPYIKLPPTSVHRPHAYIPLIPHRDSGLICSLCRFISPDLGEVQEHVVKEHPDQHQAEISCIGHIQSFFEGDKAVWFPSSAPPPALIHPTPRRAPGVTPPAYPARPHTPIPDTQRYPSPAPSDGSEALQAADGVKAGPAPISCPYTPPAQTQPAPQLPAASGPPSPAPRAPARRSATFTAAVSYLTSIRDRISALEQTSAQATALVEQQRVQINKQNQQIVLLSRALTVSATASAARDAKQAERIDALLSRIEEQDRRVEHLQERGKQVDEVLAQAAASAHEQTTKQAEMRGQLDKLELLRGSIGQYVKKNEARVEEWDGRLGELERLCAERPDREVRDVGVGPEEMGGAEDFSPVPLKSSPKDMNGMPRDEVDNQLDVEVDDSGTGDGYASGLDAEEVEEEATPPETQLPDYDEDDISVFAPSPSQSDEDDWTPPKSVKRSKKRPLRRIMSEEANEVGEPADIPEEKEVAVSDEPAAGALGRDTKRRRLGEAVLDARVNGDEPAARDLEQPRKACSRPDVQTLVAYFPRFISPLRRTAPEAAGAEMEAPMSVLGCKLPGKVSCEGLGRGFGILGIS